MTKEAGLAVLRRALGQMLFYVAFYKLDVVALRQEVLAVYTAGAPPLNIRELSQHLRT